MPSESQAEATSDSLQEALLHQLVRLAGSARRAGVAVSVEQLVTLVRGLGAVSRAAPAAGLERPALRRIVGLTLATSEADVAVLELLVDAFFPPPGAASPQAGGAPATNPEAVRQQLSEALRHGDVAAGAGAGELAADLAGTAAPPGGAVRAAHLVLRALDLSVLLSRALAGATGDAIERRVAQTGAEESLAAFEAALLRELRRREAAERAANGGAVDLHGLFDHPAGLTLAGSSRAEQERLRAVVRPLSRRLASRARRRRRRGQHHLDVRRTLGRSVTTGGVPMELRFRRHDPRRPQLVVLADVSGSMVDYAGFTLGLLQALRDEIPSLRCYAFVDGAAEVTEELLRRPALLGAALPMIPGVVAGDGHSDYGAAFSAFERVARAALSPATSLIVLGDGRSRAADPGEDGLRRLAARVRRVYWMTPEPASSWAEGDCRIHRYRRWCHRVDHVNTVAQLERWVEEVLLVRS